VSPERVDTEVDGRHLSLSNLAKVLYPETGFTKGQVIEHYARVADVMLPHLRDRAITMKRYPDGVEGQFFFEKHVPRHAPEWIRTVEVPRAFSSRSKDDSEIEYAVVWDRPTLIWAANLASIEFHAPLWRVGNGKDLPKNPDYMVFDLDPGPGTSIVECCQVALWIAHHLEVEEILAKTSGSKGLQLYRRIDGLSGDEANEAAHEIARAVERAYPDAVVSNMKKELRRNKVLIDWSQNSPAKTTVAVYSLRPEPADRVDAGHVGRGRRLREGRHPRVAPLPDDRRPRAGRSPR
jgi:bifunctional non-homologous end joining protein LigD